MAICHSNLLWRKRNAKTFREPLKVQSLTWHGNQWICNANIVRVGAYGSQVRNGVLAQVSGRMAISLDSQEKNWVGHT